MNKYLVKWFRNGTNGEMVIQASNGIVAAEIVKNMVGPGCCISSTVMVFN